MKKNIQIHYRVLHTYARSTRTYNSLFKFFAIILNNNHYNITILVEFVANICLETRSPEKYTFYRLYHCIQVIYNRYIILYCQGWIVSRIHVSLIYMYQGYIILQYLVSCVQIHFFPLYRVFFTGKLYTSNDQKSNYVVSN